MSQWTKEEVEKTISEISKETAINKDLRKLALENPAQAIKQLTGRDIPEGYKIKIIENEPDVDYTFVLPNFQTEELSELELENVSGARCRGRCDEWDCGYNMPH
jgi:hypothetical protein